MSRINLGDKCKKCPNILDENNCNSFTKDGVTYYRSFCKPCRRKNRIKGKTKNTECERCFEPLTDLNKRVITRERKDGTVWSRVMPICIPCESGASWAAQKKKKYDAGKWCPGCEETLHGDKFGILKFKHCIECRDKIAKKNIQDSQDRIIEKTKRDRLKKLERIEIDKRIELRKIEQKNKKKFCTNSKCGVLLTSENRVRAGVTNGKTKYRGNCMTCHTAQVKKLRPRKTTRVVGATHCIEKDCGVLLTDENKRFTGKVSKKNDSELFGHKCLTCFSKEKKVKREKTDNSRTCISCEKRKQGQNFPSVKNDICKVCVKKESLPPLKECEVCHKEKKPYSFDDDEANCKICTRELLRQETKIKNKKYKLWLKELNTKKIKRELIATENIIEKVTKKAVKKKQVIKKTVIVPTIKLSTSEKMKLEFAGKAKLEEEQKLILTPEEMIADFKSKNNVVMSRKTARYCESELYMEDGMDLANQMEG